MYVALEGIKGSGKSTVFERIVRDFNARSLSFCTLRPTAVRPASILDAIYTRSGKYWPDVFVERLYASRANDAARQAPKRVGLTLGERSIITSYVTRWRALDTIKYLSRVDCLHRYMPLPNHVIFLAIEPERASERIARRPTRAYGLRDESLDRLQHADRTYRYLADSGHKFGMSAVGWSFIDADRHIDTVTADVAETICRVAAITPCDATRRHRTA